MSDRLRVDIRIDPACPWAWLTSRWLEEVSRLRDIEVHTRLFNLYHMNRTPEGELRPGHEPAIAALRVLVAARRAGGDSAVARVYTELGEAIHERGEERNGGMLRRALAGAGLDEGLERQAMEDASTLSELNLEHDRAAAAGVFGVPTLEIEGSAPVFGPVIDRQLSREDAGELWDHLLWAIRRPDFFELKRNRTAPPQIGRNREDAAA